MWQSMGATKIWLAHKEMGYCVPSYPNTMNSIEKTPLAYLEELTEQLNFIRIDHVEKPTQIVKCEQIDERDITIDRNGFLLYGRWYEHEFD